MFVVRRAFRNYGQMMAPGSVVEPGTIKRFKSRLKDGHIVEVSEQDFDKWDNYFRVRIGVAIRLPEQPENEQPENEQPENEQPENEQPENEQPENEQPENEPIPTVKAVPDSNPGDKPKVVVKPK